MQLGMGSTPAPGVVTGALASHYPGCRARLTVRLLATQAGHPAGAPAGNARGGRAPLHLHSYALAGDLFSREPDVGDLIDQYLQLLKLGRFGRVGVCAQLQGAADVRAEG